MIRPALVAAYRATAYTVRVGRRAVTLHIGRRSAAMDAVLRREGVGSGAFITACNPLSRRASKARNDAANAALSRELRVAGHEFLDAVARGARAGWAEPGVFALGIGVRAAARIARRYRQNAIVCLETGRAPRLVLLR